MKQLLAIVLLCMLSAPVLAEKPADKGQSKPAKELKMEHKSVHDEKASGFEKQQEKKSEQVQKELGKGSEQGQAAREEHRKKWWKFWE